MASELSHEECGINRRKAYRIRHRDAIREYRKRYNNEQRHKRTAHLAVQSAVRAGALKAPSECSMCLGKVEVQAHHDDYNKALDVRWLCRRCHHAIHGKRLRHGKVYRGSEHVTSKLTEVEVVQIRAAVSSGRKPTAVACEFGVHESTIRLIVKRKTWAHV